MAPMENVVALDDQDTNTALVDRARTSAVHHHPKCSAGCRVHALKTRTYQYEDGLFRSIEQLRDGPHVVMAVDMPALIVGARCMVAIGDP